MTAAAELAGSHQLGDDRRGGLRGFALERFQALLQLGLGGFSFGSHALPEGAIRLRLLCLRLDAVQCSGLVLVLGAVLSQFRTQRVEFGLQFGAFMDRRRWRLERTRLERRVLEGAVEPDAKLPGQAQRKQRDSMIASQPMIGIVAGLPDLMKQRTHLARHDALILQAAQQIDLFLICRRKQADVGSDQLRHQFGQLTQFQQAGVGVVGEVALRQQTEAQELLVVQAELSEVAGPIAQCHGINLR